PKPPKRSAEIVLRHRPIERRFRTRRESEIATIEIDRLSERGIVAEFIPLFVKFVRLTEDIFPLQLWIEGRDKTGGLGIFSRCRFIGELQIIDARVKSQKFRL